MTDRVSRKIALQIAKRDLESLKKTQPERIGAIAKAEANVAALEAMKGRWVAY